MIMVGLREYGSSEVSGKQDCFENINNLPDALQRRHRSIVQWGMGDITHGLWRAQLAYDVIEPACGKRTDAGRREHIAKPLLLKSCRCKTQHVSIFLRDCRARFPTVLKQTQHMASRNKGHTYSGQKYVTARSINLLCYIKIMNLIFIYSTKPTASSMRFPLLKSPFHSCRKTPRNDYGAI